ncbi:hypothetical protein T458_06255 [Brevibacillus panacihumi W25]|uniref:Uncharacterized protein n=2 Tax=Brevibacillus panacihumi TaxID=497735 RepID=V6MBR1_9BACL|nr:hypothetical protein T458_06255 [Brevibacillus panacihumi W25]
MLQMANYEFIRKQHFVLDKSIRQISRETGYSRQVIRKAPTSTQIPCTRFPNRSQSQLLSQLNQSSRNGCVKMNRPLQSSDILPNASFKDFSKNIISHVVNQPFSAMFDKFESLHKKRTFLSNSRQGSLLNSTGGEVDVLLFGKQVTVQVFFLCCTYSRKIFF